MAKESCCLHRFFLIIHCAGGLLVLIIALIALKCGGDGRKSEVCQIKIQVLKVLDVMQPKVRQFVDAAVQLHLIIPVKC